MEDRFKFRQALYKDGVFTRFHYWGDCTADNCAFKAPILEQYPEDNFIVKPSEQSTGLSDKNYSLVYFGDILEIDGKRATVIQDDNLSIAFKPIDGYYDWEFVDYYDIPRMIIVSNIHEATNE